MFRISYTESKAYQNELIKKAEIERLIRTASGSQKKHFSLWQVIQKLFSPGVQTPRSLEFYSLKN